VGEIRRLNLRRSAHTNATFDDHDVQLIVFGEPHVEYGTHRARSDPPSGDIEGPFWIVSRLEQRLSANQLDGFESNEAFTLGFRDGRVEFSRVSSLSYINV
jgi:hypothetical protein